MSRLDILNVLADRQCDDGCNAVVRVFWCTGKNRKGALNIILASACSDKLAAAEAVAIRYLLSDQKVHGNNRTGSNLRLIVSKGALKKLSRQATQKLELYEYGYPLMTRYSEAEILVSKDRSWLPDAGNLLDIPCVDGESMKGIEKMETCHLGAIGVSRHALERYGQCCGTLDLNASWQNLNRRLKGRLDNIALPYKVLLHKLSKYGEAPEIWKHPDNPLHFLFVSQGDCKVLVTVFNRKDFL